MIWDIKPRFFQIFLHRSEFMGWCVIMDWFDAADTGARSAFLIEINKLSKNTFSVKLSSDRTTFRDWNLEDWTFQIKEHRIQHAIWCFARARNDRSVALKWNPNLIFSLRIRLKMIDPGFITCNYFFQTTWVTLIIFFYNLQCKSNQTLFLLVSEQMGHPACAHLT